MSDEEKKQFEADTSESSDMLVDATDQPVPFQGPEDDRIRELARVVSHSSTAPSSRASTFGDFENPFTSDDPRLDPSSSDFEMKFFAKNIMRMYRSDPERYPEAKLGVAFRDLSAYGYSQDVNYQVTTGNLPLWFAEQAMSLFGKGSNSRVDILKPMDGCVKPQELCVVLGRPGAGCSTFLRTMAAQTYGFKLDEKSKLTYSGLSPQEIAKTYRGDVTYCAESELHFPTLTVGDTLGFAARLKTPSNRAPGMNRMEFANYMRDLVMAMYGLSHTVNTRVGNDMVRGVSGGERKRVSIAELALTGSSLQCWDNSTRGLDAATALEFVRTLRMQAETFSDTSLVAVYQASEEMYELFDKALVLYEGYQIYFGPISKARQFFYDMGWQPKPRQSTPDFLTSLSQPSERLAREGYEDKVPHTAEQFYALWRASELYQDCVEEADEFFATSGNGSEDTSDFINAFQKRKAKSLPRQVAYTVSWSEQIRALCVRGWKRMRGSPEMTVITIFMQVVMGFVVGSMFYNLKYDTESFYSRTAVVFFALLFNAFSVMLEIFAVFEARPIVQKHHMYAFYHPAIDAVASIITEMPVKILTCLAFNLTLYFMVNLRREPGNFFFYLLIMFTSTMFMSHLFRTLAGFTNSVPEAMVPANVCLLVLVIFTGFVIPTTRMHGWCRWLNYLDPLSYSYESLMTNEFHNYWYPCTNTNTTSQFIPYPPDVAAQYGSNDSFICQPVGSRQGYSHVLGDDYLGTQYEYKFSHQWRNFGILLGFTFFSLFTYMLLVYLNPGARTKGEVLVYPRDVLRRMIKKRRQHPDESEKKEKDLANLDAAEIAKRQQEVAANLLDASDEVFYWKDVCYDIKIKGEPRRLLNYVDGWVKPGTTTALMGASGAGKTTLLDTLANRVTMGVVHGMMFVNGIPRDDGFQRSTGYAMQQDLHLETSTVREALVFSAILRQPYSTPYKEKIAYVDNVLKILEMEDYADAVVGVPGAGLNVEQRKRLTIGVELAAKPKLLLFLDEPTSGLDSQTAWSVCQLIKKLSSAGQAILCTIHQPSALLLEQFDRLLFLARGGRTIYFGDIGAGCKTLINYFESKGSQPCPAEANPAEWILDVVGAAPGSKALKDWPDVWLRSDERREVRSEISRMMTEYGADVNNTNPDKESQREFAAPLWQQYVVVLTRIMQQYWRTPSYIWAKVALNIFNALFNGFVFFKADLSLQGMQNLMFSVFMFTVCLPTMIQQYLPTFVAARNLYEARERPSKIFSWKAFVLSILTAEMPYQIVIGTFAFLCWYYPAGFYSIAENAESSSGSMIGSQMTQRAGLVYFYIIIFYIFGVTLGQLVVAPMGDADAASNLGMMFYSLSLMFCGVLRTKDEMPGFWKFMYRVSPMTYWIGGVLGLAISNAHVTCEDTELKYITPPSGMSCEDYFSKFISTLNNETEGLAGDLTSASGGRCQYCPTGSTNAFLTSVNIHYRDRWRNLGIFWAYIGFNVFMCSLLYYLARVPKKSSRVAKPTEEELKADDRAIDEANAAEH